MPTRTDIHLFLELKSPVPRAGWFSFSGRGAVELPKDYRLFDLLGLSEDDSMVEERGFPLDLSPGANRYLVKDNYEGLHTKTWITFDEFTAVLMARKSPPVEYAALYAAALEFRKAGYEVRLVYCFD